jgi:hypothetical protein
MEMKEPLLGLFAEPAFDSNRIARHAAGEELLTMEGIYRSSLVDKGLDSISVVSVTKYTKVLNETRDDE